MALQGGCIPPPSNSKRCVGLIRWDSPRQNYPQSSRGLGSNQLSSKAPPEAPEPMLPLPRKLRHRQNCRRRSAFLIVQAQHPLFLSCPRPPHSSELNQKTQQDGQTAMQQGPFVQPCQCLDPISFLCPPESFLPALQ